jgi:metal-responsive CopG/Arc/MetJ family transcriptional regulator
MPSETIYLPAPHMDTVDDVMADTDAQNRSQAIQHIIEDYHDA